MKNHLITLLILSISSSIYSQCNYKTTHRPDGIEMNYFNPQPVAKQESIEIGLAIYKNKTTAEYFLNVSILFKKGVPKELTGSATIQTKSNEGISLPIEVSEVVKMNGRDVSIGLYRIDERDFKILENYSLKSVFVNLGNKLTGANITMNEAILINQLKCL